MIPYGRQAIDEDDVKAVLSVMKADYLTQGPLVPDFEDKLSEKIGVPYTVVVNSATSALHIACMALGLGRGDYLWTSPISFVASANCAIYCGANVDFVDIDPETYLLCPSKLEEKLQIAERHGRLPKIVVAVHLAGQPCEMKKIHKLASKYGFLIIEDASHAIGSYYKGELIGNCRFSDVTVFSFHPVKIITSAEGGAALTQNENLAKKMKLLRSHGVTREKNLLNEKELGSWYYEQIHLGYNYRMTEIQAALGISQLKKLDYFVSRRINLSSLYDDKLSSLPLKLPWQHPDGISSRHLYVIQLKLSQNNFRFSVFEKLKAEGIGVNVHYIPIHTQPYYRKMGFGWGDFPIAEDYYNNAISLPIFPNLTDREQDYIVSTLKNILEERSI